MSCRVIICSTLGAVLLCGILGGCAGKESAAAPATQPMAGAPVNKYCPVDTDKPIDPKVLYVYDGKTYGFCCPDCINDFKKDPAKYAAQAK